MKRILMMLLVTTMVGSAHMVAAAGTSWMQQERIAQARDWDSSWDYAHGEDEGTYSTNIFGGSYGAADREARRESVRGSASVYRDSVLDEPYMLASAQILTEQRDQLTAKVRSGKATAEERARYYQLQDQLVEYHTRHGEAKTPENLRRITGMNDYVPMDQRITEMQDFCNEESPLYDPSQCDVGALAAMEAQKSAPVLPGSDEVRSRALTNMARTLDASGSRRCGISDGSGNVDDITHAAKESGAITPTQSSGIRQAAILAKQKALASGHDEIEANAIAVRVARQLTEQAEHDNETAWANASARVQAQYEAQLAVADAAQKAEAQDALQSLRKQMADSNCGYGKKCYVVNDDLDPNSNNWVDVTANGKLGGDTMATDYQPRY